VRGDVGTIFFIFIDFFFEIVFFTFCLTHDQSYESMTGPIGQRLLT
jgi:hypothetical protein